MPPPYAPEFRPYRVTTYVVFLVFTFSFIGLVIRSVWIDLYRKEPAAAYRGQLSLTACREEIETLHNRLDARLNNPMGPRAEGNWPKFKQDWDTFTRQFEDDLQRVQAECADAASGPAGAAIAESTERLDALREHLARCGEEGEAEREAVTAALQKLRAVQPSPGR